MDINFLLVNVVLVIALSIVANVMTPATTRFFRNASNAFKIYYDERAARELNRLKSYKRDGTLLYWIMLNGIFFLRGWTFVLGATAIIGVFVRTDDNRHEMHNWLMQHLQNTAVLWIFWPLFIVAQVFAVWSTIGVYYGRFVSAISFALKNDTEALNSTPSAQS